MKPDLEAYLEAEIMRGRSARNTIQEMLDAGRIQSPKQAWATLEKWAWKGRWDCGVALDLGWFTDKINGARR